MKPPSLGKIFEDMNNCVSEAGVEEILRKHANNVSLRDLVRISLDGIIEWALPVGTPPYKVSPYVDVEGMMYREMRRLYLFFKGGLDTLTQVKRERIFIEVLETVAPIDAKWLINIKDKILPEFLTYEVVEKVWPSLISAKNSTRQEPNNMAESNSLDKPQEKKPPSEAKLASLARAREAKKLKKESKENV